MVSCGTLEPAYDSMSWRTIDDLVRESKVCPIISYVPNADSFKLYVSTQPATGYCRLELGIDGRRYIVQKYDTRFNDESNATRDLKKYCRLLERGQAEIKLSGDTAEIVALPPKKKKSK
ncbi:MAG: hypothetical protein Q7K45_02840 [Nanoarchaeota archaeon]|nr:hypothetical protein [Nanoarchaeota archaeon]